MVFPSPACITCKKRRVKCDSARPDCSQCRKGNRSCIWQSDQSGVWQFKSENAFAKGKPRRPRAGREIQCSRPTMFNESPSPEAPLSMPVEVYALNYWVSNFTAWPGDLQEIQSEYGACAIHYWENSSVDSTLRLAVSAFSLAKFGKAMRSGKAIREAESVYWKCVKNMRTDIENISRETIDPLLIATLLMAVYDNVMQSDKGDDALATLPSTKRSSSNIGHCKGAVALLQLRNAQGWKSNANLDRAVRRPVARAYILRGLPVPEWLQMEDVGIEDPVARLDNLHIHVATIRSLSLQGTKFRISSCTDSSISQLKTLVRQTEKLNLAFEDWPNSLTSEWDFSVVDLGGFPAAQDHRSLYEGSTHNYSTLGHATTWNRYRAGHLIVISAMLRILNTLARVLPHDRKLDAQVERYQSTAHSLTVDICRSVAFFLLSDHHNASDYLSISDQHMSPMSATLLAWPLTIASGIEYVHQDHRDWLRTKLEIISVILGTNLLISVIEDGFII